MSELHGNNITNICLACLKITQSVIRKPLIQPQFGISKTFLLQALWCTFLLPVDDIVPNDAEPGTFVLVFISHPVVSIY